MRFARCNECYGDQLLFLVETSTLSLLSPCSMSAAGEASSKFAGQSLHALSVDYGGRTIEPPLQVAFAKDQGRSTMAQRPIRTEQDTSKRLHYALGWHLGRAAMAHAP